MVAEYIIMFFIGLVTGWFLCKGMLEAKISDQMDIKYKQAFFDAMTKLERDKAVNNLKRG